MSGNKIKRILFIFIVIVVYMFFAIWMGEKIWSEPNSLFEKSINAYEGRIIFRDSLESVKFEIQGGYKTQAGHHLYEYAGWQAQKDPEWEFTLEGILLQKEDIKYMINVHQESLEYASGKIGSNLKTDKYGFRAIFPVAGIKKGIYQVSLLLKNGEAIHTNEILVVE